MLIIQMPFDIWHRQRQRCLLGIAVSLLIVLATVRSAAACSPPRATPWFTEQVYVDPSTLPSGLRVQTRANTIAIANLTTTPLYLLGKDDHYGAVAHLPTGVPADFEPVHKLVSGQVWSWQPDYGRDPSQPPHWIWQQASADSAPDLLLYADDNFIYSHGPFLLPLASYNQTGDDRPANPPLPAPQRVVVTMLYDQQVLVLPVTISYLLNPAYDPRSMAKARQMCQQSSPPDAITFLFDHLVQVTAPHPLVLGGLCLLPLVLIGAVVFWRLRQMRNNE